MNKKADQLMAILLIVLFTLLLVGLSFFYLAYKSQQIRQFTDSNIESLYIREKLLNLYVQDIMDSSAKISGEDKSIFILEFKKRLDLYKRNGQFIVIELEQIEPQLQESNIKIENGKIELPLNFKIGGWTTENKVYAEYSYDRTFERTIEKV
jgi:hypothetical protein